MAIISKIAFSTSVLFTFVMLGTFLIGTGCEQILDEALQEKITVEEELFGSQDHENGDSERVLVVGEFAILGAAPSAFAKPGESAFWLFLLMRVGLHGFAVKRVVNCGDIS